MRKDDWTDEKIITAIKSKTKDRDNAFRYIYIESGWRNEFLKWTTSNRSSLSDFKDAFQDALIVFDKYIRNNNFRNEGKLKHYFLRIARNKWVDIQRKKRPTDEYGEFYEKEIAEDVEKLYISEEKKNYLLKALDKIKGRCKKILWLDALDYSPQEIANEMNLSSGIMASKESYRCRKRWRKFFDDNPQWKNLI